MSKTPICDYVNEYISINKARLHMPGHKGADVLGFEKFDITEIEGADDLANPKGIILESENNATALFDTGHSYFVTGGSSQSIKAMIYLAKLNSKTNSNLILAGRNAHKAFLHSVSLLDIDVKWLYPSENETDSICSCRINAKDLEEALKTCAKKPMAVYITTPDYLGGMCDVLSLSKVCKKHDVPLLIDNAHGAYLKFLSEDMHPISLGADMVCDSAHKTLPSITGAAYLHVSKNINFDYEKRIRQAISYFGSSSPSYLILQSLDKLNEILTGNFKHDLDDTVKKIDELKNFLMGKSVKVLLTDKLKLTIDSYKSGYTSSQIKKMLDENDIVIEYMDKRYIVLMFTPYNKQEDFEKIYAAFSNFVQKEPLACDALEFSKASQVISFNKALFSNFETLKVEDAKGRVCASCAVSCPPAIPIVISGELISDEVVHMLKKYEIEFIDVIK